MQRRFQLFAGSEVMTLQDLFDATVETLSHAVGLRRCWWRQAVFNLQCGAQLVELMSARHSALAKTKEAIRELLSFIRQHSSNAHGTRAFQITQEASGVGGCLGGEDADEDPAGRPVDGHEEITTAVFISHLGQILDVDMQLSRLLGFEGVVLSLGRFGLEVTQVADPMTPQTAVETRP